MKTTFLLFVCMLFGLNVLIAQVYHADPYAEEMGWYVEDDDRSDRSDHRGRRPRLQAALILDASGSMDGLIDQAKAQLWYMANGMLEAYEGHRPPILEFALLEYGTATVGRRSNYMRVIVPFTDDLDWISEELFRMRTNGRYEYAGAAVDMALRDLNWTSHPDDLRMIYLAGNEAIQQGPVSFQRALDMAYSRDVYTQFIFCGPHNKGISLGWADAAREAGTEYLTISHDRPVYYEHNAYDDRLWTYNDRLNSTYIPYGASGYQRYERMCVQDRNAYRYGQGPAAQRVITKSSSGYAHTDWDLVDAISSGTVRLAELPPHHLPREMRGMSMAQKQTYINRKRSERMALRKEIRDMRQQKKRHARPARPAGHQGHSSQSASKPEPRTLDQAVIKATRKQEMKKRTPAPSRIEKGRTPAVRPARSSTNPVVRPAEHTRPIPKATRQVTESTQRPRRATKPVAKPTPAAPTAVQRPTRGAKPARPAVKSAARPAQEAPASSTETKKTSPRVSGRSQPTPENVSSAGRSRPKPARKPVPGTIRR